MIVFICNVCQTIDVVKNEFVASRLGILSNAIVHYMLFTLYVCYTIVPGLTGSQLNAQDSSNTSCNTNDENIRIYVNFTHITNETDCFIQQMT